MQLPDFWLALANMNITPVLLFLHWLPVHFKIELKILLFVCKVMNGPAPSYLSDLLSLYSPGRGLRSSNQKLLLVPRSRLEKKGDQAFAIAGPKLWNSLPVSIRIIATDSLFKTRLKAYLFERVFNAFYTNMQISINVFKLIIIHFYWKWYSFLSIKSAY